MFYWKAIPQCFYDCQALQNIITSCLLRHVWHASVCNILVKKKKKKKNRELHLSVFNTIYQWIKGPWCLGTWFRTSFQNCLPLIWLFPPWCYPKFIPFSQNSSTHMHAPKVPYEILPTWIMKVSSSKICCDCHSPVLRLSSGSNTLRESVF